MPDPDAPTFVLLHGAGHTARVWASVREHLRHPSIAVDLPGRRNRPGDLTAITIEDAVRSVTADLVTAQIDGRVVLVGHSAGGITLPALAGALTPRVEHLVFVAGLCAPHGHQVVDTVRPGHRAAMDARLAELRERYRGSMLEPDGIECVAPRVDDGRLAAGIESLNLMSQTVDWRGVPPAVPRTFVRCLRDRIQSPELQDRLIVNCGASTVLEIDAGHTPALDTPAALAELLDRIAEP